MRAPIFRVTSNDYSDPAYPLAVSLPTLCQNADPAYDDVCKLRVGETVTVGGGAFEQFTVERIR